MLGVGIIIPVIPALFFSENSGFFDASVSQDSRSIIYGFLIACYPFMQFFGAPILGSLSDRYGRRPLISISLVGTFIGYLLFAYAILIQNLELLFFSRLLPGFTGGNISIMFSAIADISKPEEKTRNFGLVGAAFGIGFILGPALGGFLADPTVYASFNAATPFWFTAILTLINLIMVQFRFPETLKEKRDSPVSLWTGFRNIRTALGVPNLRTIFFVVLLLSLGFTFFTQFFSVLLLQKFSYSEKNIGLLYGWIGIWLVFTQGFIVRKMSGRISPGSLLKVTTICLAVAVALIVVPNQTYWFYLIAPFIAISQGITSPNMTTVISNQVGEDRQGEIMGINQSLNALGQTVPPIIAGYLNTLGGSFPILAGAVLIACGWLVFTFIFSSKTK